MDRVREVIGFLILNFTITSYLAYCNYSRVAPLSEDEQTLYDDL